MIGARQLNTANLPSQSWVNQHLQYTHGIGAAVLAGQRRRLHHGQPELRRRRTCRRSRPTGCRSSTQPGHLLRHPRPRLGRRRHQAARARLPGELGRERRCAGRDPLRQHRWRAGRQHLQPHGVRAATRRLQLPDLEPDHLEEPRALRARRPADGPEGRAVPHLRLATPTPSSPTARCSTCSTATPRPTSTPTARTPRT